MPTTKDQYLAFLKSKIRVAEKKGITVSPDRLHPSTKPHERDIILWALSLGAALVAPDCGLGKTHMGIETMRILQEENGGKCLILTELGASDTFCNPDPEVGDGARLGVPLKYVTDQQEAMACAEVLVVTNYERVRMGNFDFSKFTAVWLDEGNYIKNMASETTNSLREQLKRVKYKYIASATPSPNETLELVNYAHVLGIADRGQILTQFFQRNSVKAGELTLHPQHESDFWLWVNSWMIAIENPSDLGYEDKGYELPELRVFWHEIKLNKAIDPGIDKRTGQKKLFLETGNSLPDNAKIKRESINRRLEEALKLIRDNPKDHWIIWHHLESERAEITRSFKGKNYDCLYGSLDIEHREKIIVDFTKGNLQYLGTKPSVSGVGCNFQWHCHKAVLLGVDNDFNMLYQMLKRIHRPFNPSSFVEFHIFYLPEEYSIVQNLKRKWEQHKQQREWLNGIVRTYGLNHDRMIAERKRTFKVERKEMKGERYTLVNTDAVFEWMGLPDNSIKLINTSFPFGNHYEYTSLYNDFGHNTTNKEFFHQMDYLIPELYRTLEPGRICAVHLKNRIHYGSVTGLGFSIFHRFTHHVCDSMEKHGFYTMGFHYIPTDVVAENNQTYRLTYGEMLKDSTKMGSGIPEEIWIFRKPPTSSENAYCDFPVTHDRIEYSLALWQIDADSFWKSDHNRLLTPVELKTYGLDKVSEKWRMHDKKVMYDHSQHVELLKELDEENKLSRTFTTLPFESNTDFIWSGVNRMNGLNMEQSRRKERNHICPQPFDEAGRIIELYSNKNELVADPFGGLCTTGVMAIRKGRNTFLTELNDEYARCGNIYLKEAEIKEKIPTLFDLAE